MAADRRNTVHFFYQIPWQKLFSLTSMKLKKKKPQNRQEKETKYLKKEIKNSTNRRNATRTKTKLVVRFSRDVTRSWPSSPFERVINFEEFAWTVMKFLFYLQVSRSHCVEEIILDARYIERAMTQPTLNDLRETLRIAYDIEGIPFGLFFNGQWRPSRGSGCFFLENLLT